ncbi:DUF1127 domain-containing protein [Litoreibacter halocynthiae]|nr:DUF1127 domain-containing protein [Litoreibacter halocynthiae]
MAYISQTQPIALFERISDFFASLLSAVDVAASANTRIREMEHLNARSDAQLEKMGLRREDIARHVFRDIYDF